MITINKDNKANCIVSELDNIKSELDSENVYILLRYAVDKEIMAWILGEFNINKLSSTDVENLFSNTNNKKKMADILARYKTNLTQADVKLIIYYLFCY